MATLKTLLTFMLLGAFLGLATASWLGPKWLEYDNTAPLGTQTVCELPKVVRGITEKLLHYQSIGTLTGAGTFFVLGIVFVVWRNKRDKLARPPSPPAQPAA